MKWTDVHHRYADLWVLVEALSATSQGGQRVVDELTVLSAFDESTDALRRYLEVHRSDPRRELYVAHASAATLHIDERRWLGVRTRI